MLMLPTRQSCTLKSRLKQHQLQAGEQHLAKGIVRTTLHAVKLWPALAAHVEAQQSLSGFRSRRLDMDRESQ